jgi:Inner membrane component of T3SS, cytoplasmic domain
MIAITGRTLHFAQGLQRGVDVPLIAGSTCIIGSSPLLCTVVLRDEHVARRHCTLSLDARGHVTCTALDAPVWVGQRELPPGASMVMPDFLPLRCGRATLLVGPDGSDWSFSMIAAESAPGLRHRTEATLRRVRASNPPAFAALLIGSLAVAAGSVWGAVSYLAAPLRLPLDNMVRAQRWLQSVAPSGSELQLIADDNSGRWVIAGYVPTARQREALEAAMMRSADAPRSEVVAVEQMLAAVEKRAQREGLACAAAYRGAGRAECSQAIENAAAADRLRAASSRVDGLRELSLRVAAPQTVAKAPKRADGGRKFSVLMSNKRGNRLIGPAGEGYREGDTFDGMTIRKIMFDQVVFQRDKDEVVLYLAQL